MEFPAKETIDLLYLLLPGFVASWIFLGLTTHPRRDVFDQVVQALIFTTIVKVASLGARALWWWYWGHDNPTADWTDSHDLGVGVLLAVVLGVLLAACANNDMPHRFLRCLKVTKKTSFSSEWYSSFHRYPRDVILHLKSDHRLKGWVHEFPNDPDRGHFFMEKVAWVDESGKEYRLQQLKAMLVPAAEVTKVEFLCNPAELTETVGRILEEQKELAKLHNTSGDADANRQAIAPAQCTPPERGNERIEAGPTGADDTHR